MTDAYSVLGQVIPAAQTLTTGIAAVPTATSEVVSSVMVCNQNSSTAKFRISVAVAGAADTAKQYIYYDVEILPNDTFAATLGITLATTDVVRCYSDLGNVSFNFFGAQVT